MSGQPVSFYEFGSFSIDVSSRVLLREGKPVPVEPKVFDTLLMLVENRGRVVSKEELMKAVWGPDTFVEEGSLARNISLLRKMLADGFGDTQCIATFPKRGYQFVAPLRGAGATGQPELHAEEHGLGAHSDATEDRTRHSDPGPAHGQDARATAGGTPALQIHPLAARAVGAVVLALSLGYRFVRPLPAPVVLSHRALTEDGREKQSPLLTDGRRLYFKEKADGRCLLAVVPISGGDLNTYPLPSCVVSISDIAVDGTDLIGWEDDPGRSMGKLLIWPLAGGPPESLGGLQGRWPAWSPDGSRIAYNDGIHSLFVAGRHGESPRKVASVDGRPGRLLWSPDGESLCFEQRDARTEATSLWEVAAAGGLPRPLLTGWKYGAFDPAWTADGRYSVFLSAPANSLGIWARREDCNPFRWRCRQPFRLLAGFGDCRGPLASRDGKKLFVIGGHFRKELARYDLKSRTFVPYLPDVPAADLDFSHDGKWITYVRLPARNLWRSRPDQSDATPLTAAGAEVYSPHWSHDGKQIAYMTVSGQKQYKACVVAADGGPPQQLLSGPGEEGTPTWSGDGKFVVFGNTLHAGYASGMSVHLLDLTRHEVSDLPGSTGMWNPRWSPNGRYIAALVLGDETKGTLSDCPAISLYGAETRRWETLAMADRIRNLAWTRDSQYIYFHTGSPDLGLYRVQIVSKKIERLASLKGFAGVNDDWIGVTPDGSPLIIGDSRIDEVYALDMQWP